jgi:hypothetical protein
VKFKRQHWSYLPLRRYLRKTTVGVIANCRGVTGSVTFASGFDPDDGVDERRASAQSGAGSETSTINVAPVSPCITDVLDTRATLVNDEVSRESTGCEGRSKGLSINISNV